MIWHVQMFNGVIILKREREREREREKVYTVYKTVKMLVIIFSIRLMTLSLFFLCFVLVLYLLIIL